MGSEVVIFSPGNTTGSGSSHLAPLSFGFCIFKMRNLAYRNLDTFWLLRFHSFVIVRGDWYQWHVEGYQWENWYSWSVDLLHIYWHFPLLTDRNKTDIGSFISILQIRKLRLRESELLKGAPLVCGRDAIQLLFPYPVPQLVILDTFTTTFMEKTKTMLIINIFQNLKTILSLYQRTWNLTDCFRSYYQFCLLGKLLQVVSLNFLNMWKRNEMLGMVKECCTHRI